MRRRVFAETKGGRVMGWGWPVPLGWEALTQAEADRDVRIRELERERDQARDALRGIAHQDAPSKTATADELARELAAVRLAARVVLGEWGER